MDITFACGTTIDSSELNNYRYEFVPEDTDDYDDYIGEPGQQFCDIDMHSSTAEELCFRQSEGDSEYLSANDNVYISPEDLYVLERISSSNPLPLEEQMALAKSVLEKVRLASPRAVVAGGAARCFLQGEQANDIDIFLDLPPYLGVAEMRNMLNRLLPEYSITQLRGGSATQPSAVTGLRNAFHFFKDGQEVQLLVVSGIPDEQINRFPYSHTQVSWDGNRFKYHDSFDLFLDFKVVVKNYEPQQQSYKAKVEALIQERGWAIAQSQDEALTMALDSVKLTA